MDRGWLGRSHEPPPSLAPTATTLALQAVGGRCMKVIRVERLRKILAGHAHQPEPHRSALIVRDVEALLDPPGRRGRPTTPLWHSMKIEFTAQLLESVLGKLTSSALAAELKKQEPEILRSYDKTSLLARVRWHRRRAAKFGLK